MCRMMFFFSRYIIHYFSVKQLTVNIGPIRMMDLKADSLHDILMKSKTFEIKFDTTEKVLENGKTDREKTGFSIFISLSLESCALDFHEVSHRININVDTVHKYHIYPHVSQVFLVWKIRTWEVRRLTYD